MNASRHVLGAGLALAAAGVSAAGNLLGLHFASGVTHVSGTSYRTEFLDQAWHALVWLAVPLLVAAAWQSLWWALAGLLVATAVDVGGALETMQRYDESGWSDGLEVFALLAPIGLLITGAVCLIVGGVLGHEGRRKRAARDAHANGPATNLAPGR